MTLNRFFVFLFSIWWRSLESLRSLFFSLVFIEFVRPFKKHISPYFNVQCRLCEKKINIIEEVFCIRSKSTRNNKYKDHKQNKNFLLFLLCWNFRNFPSIYFAFVFIHLIRKKNQMKYRKCLYFQVTNIDSRSKMITNKRAPTNRMLTNDMLHSEPLLMMCVDWSFVFSIPLSVSQLLFVLFAFLFILMSNRNSKQFDRVRQTQLLLAFFFSSFFQWQNTDDRPYSLINCISNRYPSPLTSCWVIWFTASFLFFIDVLLRQ